MPSSMWPSQVWQWFLIFMTTVGARMTCWGFGVRQHGPDVMHTLMFDGGALEEPGALSGILHGKPHAVV